MDALFLFSDARRHDPAVEAWLQARDGALGDLARSWFEVLRGCGDDVRELLHDGHPTACVGAAAFAYVDAFKAHVNLGFYRGSELSDPTGLLEGAGRFMRHVKLRPGADLDSAALAELVQVAHDDMRRRVAAS